MELKWGGDIYSTLTRRFQTFNELEYDLWRHLDANVVSIIGEPIPELVEMRDRFRFSFQLGFDENLVVSRQYRGVEQTANHGETPIGAMYVIDKGGTI